MTHSSNTVQGKLKELRNIFSTQLPGKIQQIEEAWEDLLREGLDLKKAELAAQLLHTLAGTAGTFGFSAIRTAAKEMEAILRSSIREGRLMDAGEHLAALKGGCGEIIPALFAPASYEVTPEPSVFQPDNDKIFIIDDAPLTTEVFSLQLSCYGYDISIFSTIADFVNALKTSTPHLIIMDISFTEGYSAGPKAVADIQRGRKSPIPVIFISIRTDFNGRLEAVRAGGNAYFVKPVDVSKLADRIDALMVQKRPVPFRILIVDDEPLLADYHATVLRQAGMATEVVSDPEQAMDSLIEFKPELILMDLYMQGCSGMELASIIRQDEAYIDIPIVYLSSELDVDRQLVAMSSGGDDFLTKPIQPAHLIASLTLRADRYRTLRSIMLYDGLTGLLNHSRTIEQLGVEVSRAFRQKAEISFAMIDIDHFKSVNDTYGHPVGDQVIKSLARLLKQRLRKTDIVGRIGGEEFAVILTDIDGWVAFRILNELREAFAKIRHTSREGFFSVTFSCGIAHFTTECASTSLINEADRALYVAKNSGRNRVIYTGTQV